MPDEKQQQDSAGANATAQDRKPKPAAPPLKIPPRQVIIKAA